MKLKPIACVAIALLLSTGTLVRADAKDDVMAGIKNLADAPDYCWTQTVEGGMGASSEGKIQSDGLTYLSLKLRDDTAEIYFQGDKGAIKTDDGWQSFEDASAAGGRTPATMGAHIAKNLKSPASLAESLAKQAPELTKDGERYSGDLSDEEAQRLLRVGRGRRGAATQATNAKGSVQFWMKDGMLVKFEWRISGTVGQRDIDRTSTVEIKDIGQTKIDVPADAKAKWETPATTEPAANG